jgi:diadenosine tetraphosphatase ApaH/serine/threonine PP2A family protein phosphatase
MVARGIGCATRRRMAEAIRWALESIRWNARSLNAGYERWILSWPKTTSLEIPGLGKTLFCHATPRDDNDILTRLTNEARLLPLFTTVEADVVVCGHTHMQFDRTIDNTRVVNAGSVGMPFGAPGGEWLLPGPGIELRHTDYDLARAALRITATGFPQVPQFDMLKAPTAEKMLELYGRAEPSLISQGDRGATARIAGGHPLHSTSWIFSECGG